MKNKKIKIIFSIFGDLFDTNKFSKLIKILPTEVHIRGKIGKYRNRYKETSWDYEISTNKYELDYLSNNFLKLFKKKQYQILKFKKENKLTIKIFILFYIEDEIVPSLFFNNDFLNFVNFLNAEIDMDGYCNI